MSFKPVINNLSRKIVDLKRNSVSKNLGNYVHKVYTKQLSTSKSKIKVNINNK
jgi:hypothetical protein